MPYKDPERQREYQRQWKRERPELQRRWREKNPERMAEHRQAYRDRYPEKERAHHAVDWALRTGRLVRPDTCEGCGAECRPEGHHEDYAKPLDVVWLCVTCHANTHREGRTPAP